NEAAIKRLQENMASAPQVAEMYETDLKKLAATHIALTEQIERLTTIARRETEAMKDTAVVAQQEADALANLDTWTTRVATSTEAVHVGNVRAYQSLTHIAYSLDGV